MTTYTLTDAAKLLGLHPETLRYHLTAGHITRSGRRPGRKRRYFTEEDLETLRRSGHLQLSPEEKAEIARRYHAGESAPALAAEYSRKSVSQLRSTLGSRRSYLTEEVWDLILRRKEEGETAALLAREYGVSASRIRERVRQANKAAPSSKLQAPG